MNITIKHLKKKYPKSNFINLTSKDIIYMCRDALSHHEKKQNKENYELELLELIKSKDWNWYTQDIDKNIILTYPIYNNAYSIVEYLVGNKYDLKIYEELISNALCSCIMLTGEKMLSYLLEQNLHPEYLTDMTIRAYEMATHVHNDYKDFYTQKGNDLIIKHTDLKKILAYYISDREFKTSLEEIFFQMLENHPLPIEEKNVLITQLFEQANTIKRWINGQEQIVQRKVMSSNLEKKYQMVEKWKMYHKLEDDLSYNQQLKKKAKI